MGEVMGYVSHAGGSFLFESVIESFTAAVFESMHLWDCVPRFVRVKPLQGEPSAYERRPLSYICCRPQHQ